MTAGRNAGRRMRDALAALPALSREVFELHAILDLSFSEVADTLGMSIGDVEYVLATILVALDRARDGDIEDSLRRSRQARHPLSVIDGASPIRS